MVDGDRVARIEGDHLPVLGYGDGIKYLLILQTDEIIGIPIDHGGPDLGHFPAGLGLRQLLRLGHALVGQHLDILLFAGGNAVAGGHQLILGHIDHGVGFDQVCGVLQRDKIGGLPGDVQQDGEGGGVAQILDHALGGGHGGVLSGAGGGIEVGFLGALVGEQEAQIGLVGVGGSDAGVHIHIVVHGDIVVASGGLGHVPLAQDGVEEAVDQGAVVVVLLHGEFRDV